VRPEAARAAVSALGAIAQQDAAAKAALMALTEGASERLTHEVALALSGVALRTPLEVVTWLVAASADQRARAMDLLREGFESLEEDFAEEQFFAAARAAYWKESEGSSMRTVVATMIEQLEF